jgi:thiol-disulfide isomerase/thioredoxin
MKRLIFIVSITFLWLSVAGQESEGYRIEIGVKGVENSFLRIAYHLGDKQYIKDTIRTDQNGNAVFSGKEKLEQGLYMVVLPDNRYFEIIVSDDQEFEVSSSHNDFSGSMVFKGSEENSAFIQYQKGWRELQNSSNDIKQRLQLNKELADSIEYLSDRLNTIESEMVSYLKGVSDKYDGTILSALLKAMLPVDIPDFNLPFDIDNSDSLKWVMGYTYNKDHFFDNIDLSDSRLLRTPVLYNKINTFFTNVIIQHPDTVIKEMDRVIRLSEKEPQVFRFVIVYLFNHYRESQIMGHDAILVSLADNYYLSGKADWISDEFKADLKDDVDKIRYNLIGNKAIDLTVETFNGEWKSLNELNNSFTILYFWEPNCGHCITTTPKLKEIYDRLKPKGIDVFAICTQNNRDEWESYIIENELDWINGWDPHRDTHFDFYYNVNSTPMIYILNRDKEIIAKKLPIESVESFITNYIKYSN